MFKANCPHDLPKQRREVKARMKRKFLGIILAKNCEKVFGAKPSELLKSHKPFILASQCILTKIIVPRLSRNALLEALNR